MIEHPLNSPPGYEYRSTGPWMVSHIDACDRPKVWIMYMLDSAVVRFWYSPKDESIPSRRIMVDALGVTVLGTDRRGGEENTKMVGTREMMEATLQFVRQSPVIGPEDELEVLGMIEALRSLDGQSL